MKKIAFHLNCLVHGGAERVVSNLANKFAEEGYDVYVTVEWIDKDEFRLDPRVHHVNVGLKPEDEKKGRWVKFGLRIKYLREFLKEVQPDVLCAFMHRPNFRALTAALGLRVPVIISIRNNPEPFYSGRTDKFQIRWLFPHAAGCVYQTAEQRDFFKPYLQKNSRVIMNPVNRKYIELPDPDYEHQERCVVQSSRLVDFKNQEMLLRAFAKVHAVHPDWSLKIYGPDSEDGTKEKLEEIIRANQAKDWMQLMGGTDRLEELIPKAAIYALPSNYEGMPNALMEAMAMGMPCISTDCPAGAPRVLIQDGVNGLLIPVGDEAAMTAAILKLIENPELRRSLGQEARKIREIAGTDEIYHQWKDYLEEVIREREGKKT